MRNPSHACVCESSAVAIPESEIHWPFSCMACPPVAIIKSRRRQKERIRGERAVVEEAKVGRLLTPELSAYHFAFSAPQVHRKCVLRRWRGVRKSTEKNHKLYLLLKCFF